MSRILGLLAGFKLGDRVAGLELHGLIGRKLGGFVGLELHGLIGRKLGGFVGFKLGGLVEFRLEDIPSSVACRFEARQHWQLHSFDRVSAASPPAPRPAYLLHR